MSDITEVFQVELSGILVLDYDKDDTAPDPKSWDLPILLDELTMTMHASPTATLTLVHSSYPKEESCIICGRPGAAMQGIEHDGWCWGCVRNLIEGKGIDSYGKPFPSYPRPWAEEG